jgi:hypothetical protein
MTQAVRATLVALLTLSTCGCAVTRASDGFALPPPTGPSATRSAENVDEDAFWQIIDDARSRGASDPDAMAEVMGARFVDADRDALTEFQQQLVNANGRLYTWRHAAAAELACGEQIGDDTFTDWRSWVITLGRATFEQVAANPDNLADVEEFWGGCALAAELFGAAVGNIYLERYGLPDDDTFPMPDPDSPPSGEKLTGDQAILAALPRLTAAADRA